MASQTLAAHMENVQKCAKRCTGVVSSGNTAALLQDVIQDKKKAKNSQKV